MSSDRESNVIPERLSAGTRKSPSEDGVSSRYWSRAFETALWSVLGLVLTGSVWLFASSLNQIDASAVNIIFARPWFWRSVWLSIFTAMVTTALAMILGIPAAYAISRFRFVGRVALGVLMDSVLVLPASTIGLSLMVAFQYPPMIALQDALGIRLVHSLGSVVLAQLVLSLAFGVQAWRTAFDSVSPRYEHVARTLGSSRTRTFFTVTIPLARSGIIAGVVLAWTRAMAEFGAVLIVGGTFRMRDLQQFSELSQWLGINNADLLSVGMWMDIEAGRTEQGFAIAFSLVLISMGSIYALSRLASGNRSLVNHD
jgi:ABC-type sulfate transport system permease component